jgi:hypothetical protein
MPFAADAVAIRRTSVGGRLGRTLRKSGNAQAAPSSMARPSAREQARRAGVVSMVLVSPVGRRMETESAASARRRRTSYIRG